MLFKKLNKIQEFLAGDHTHLKEVLHPKNDNLSLGFSLAHAYLKIDEKSLPHRLAHSETYYFLSGEGFVFIDGKKQKISADDIVFVPPHAEQYVENTGNTDLKFLCIVSPPWSEETEEIEK